MVRGSGNIVMKKLAPAMVLLLACVSRVHAQQPLTVDPAGVLRELTFFSSLYPRTEGSPGEQRAIDHITERLSVLGIPYTRQSFQDLEGAHSFSSSIEVSIPGAIQDELLFIVPLDHPDGAAADADGSINLALALGIIEAMKGKTPPISVRFLFLGGEFGTDAGYPIGTKQFLSEFYPDYAVSALYVDFESIPNRTNITSGGTRIVAPYWLINRCTTAMDSGGLFYLERGNENQIFRLGLISHPPEIDPYLQAGYPSLELSGIGGTLSPDRDAEWVGSFEQFFASFLAQNASGFPTSWDRHYLFFQARFFSFILTEPQYIFVVIAVLALLLAYPIIYTDRFYRYIRTIGRNIFSIPLLLLVVFLFLLAGTFLVQGIFLVRNFPDLWRQAPLLFFACKITAALFLFALLYRFLAVLPFSRNGRFYSAGAILVFVVDSIVLGLFDFSLAYYFVWALAWSVLFSLVPSRLLKTAFLLISTAFLVKAGVDVFTLPALDVVRVLLLSKIKGNLVIALILLPFLFMIIRLDLMFRHPAKNRAIAIVRALDTILGLGALSLVVVLIRFAPFGPGSPQPIVAEETVNVNANVRVVTVTSPAPLGKLAVDAGTERFAIATRARRFRMNVPGSESLLSTDVQAASFLDRKQIDLTVDPVGTPIRASVTLTSKNEIIIFDANFPFSYNPGSTTAEIHIGQNPPVPLDVQFTLPQDAVVVVTVRIEYTTLPDTLEVHGDNIAVQRRLVVTKQLTIGGNARVADPGDAARGRG
jgi:hypothetical protein